MQGAGDGGSGGDRIVEAAPGDVGQCVGVLHAAFSAEPFMAWQTGGVQTAARALVHYTVEYSLRHGRVWTLRDETGAVVGAVCVLPPGVVESPERAAQVLACVPGALQLPARVAHGASAVHQMREGVVPRSTPVCHLWMVGVAQRGRGGGSRLVQHVLAQYPDALVYLETDSAGKVAWYRRFGFGVRAECRAVDGGDAQLSDTLYAMVCEPAALRDKRLHLEAAAPPVLVAPALAARLYDACMQRGDTAIALEEPTGRRLGYGGLARAALTLASVLEAGSRVAIVCRSSIDYVVAVLAVLFAGATYVPVDPVLPAARVSYILSDSGAQVVLTHAPSMHAVPDAWPREHVVDVERAAAEGTPLAAPRASAPLAYVIYTSGSTGNPKGVMVPTAGVTNTIVELTTLIALQSGERVVHFYGVGFDGSGVNLFVPLLAGATVVTKHPHHEWAVQMASCPVAFVTPSALASFDDGVVARWRAIVIGGESLGLAQVRRMGPTAVMFNIYGPTEASIVTSVGVLRAQDDAVHIGRPLANMAYSIVDPRTLEPVPFGTLGELVVQGVGVAHGYVNLPERTAAAFLPGQRYRTGDLCCYRVSDGCVQHWGRIETGQVKVRGHRIELREIEIALAALDGVRSCVVFAHGDALWAYVTPHWSPEAMQSARRQLEQQLPPYMVPEVLEALDVLPLNANGKVDVEQLKTMPVMATRPSAAPYIAPRDNTERTVCCALERVLDLPPNSVGIDHSFFELGLHSLLAMRLAHELHSAGLTRFGASEIIHRPSVRELVAGSPSQQLLVQFSEQPPHVCSVVVVLLHGSNGSLGFLRSHVSRLLLRHLPPVSVYGIHWGGSMRADQHDVVAWAAKYATVVRSVLSPGQVCHLAAVEHGNVFAVALARALGPALVAKVVLVGTRFLHSDVQCDPHTSLAASFLGEHWEGAATEQDIARQGGASWLQAREAQFHWLSAALVEQQQQVWSTVDRMCAAYMRSHPLHPLPPETVWLVVPGDAPTTEEHLVPVAVASHWATLARDAARDIASELLSEGIFFSSDDLSQSRFDDLRASVLSTNTLAADKKDASTSAAMLAAALERDAQQRFLFAPPAAVAQRPPPPPTMRGQRVIVTGATGFLGPYIVRALLEAGAERVIALVRAPTDAAAAQRARTALNEIGGIDADLFARVHGVAGDLAAGARLGLSSAAWSELARSGTAIVHNGALVNHALDYAQLRASHVGATLQVLELASVSSMRVVYVSTVGTVPVGPLVRETLDCSTALDVAQHAAGYGQAKWVSERLVARVPGSLVVRPAMIGWATGTGHCSQTDWPINACRVMRLLRAVPRSARSIDFAPVDWVARSIVQPARPVGVINVSGRSCAWSDLCAALMEPGWEWLAFGAWIGRVQQLARDCGGRADREAVARTVAPVLVVLGGHEDFPHFAPVEVSATDAPSVDRQYLECLVNRLRAESL